jgi:hypothetical protein
MIRKFFEGKDIHVISLPKTEWEELRKLLEENGQPIISGPKTMLCHIALNRQCSDADVIERAGGKGILPILRDLPEWFTYENGFWGLTEEGLNAADEILRRLFLGN